MAGVNSARQQYLFLLVVVVCILSSHIVYAFRPTILRPFRYTRATALDAKATYKVTLQHEGKEHVLDVREDVSVLEAALDAGIDLPHDCKLGVCLTCPSKVVSGKVDQSGTTLDDSVLAQGYALTCCVYPRGDMTIKSIEEDELVSAQFQGRS
jgi:ferredoxin